MNFKVDGLPLHIIKRNNLKKRYLETFFFTRDDIITSILALVPVEDFPHACFLLVAFLIT